MEQTSNQTPKLTSARFIDLRTHRRHENVFWPVVVVPREDLILNLQSISEGQPGKDRRREFLVSHPYAGDSYPGLAPGIEALFGVLNPGERTETRRSNISAVSIVLGGTARAVIEGANLDLTRWDVWITPSMCPHFLENTTDEPFEYLSYSNASLLERLEILYDELLPGDAAFTVPQDSQSRRPDSSVRAKDAFPPIDLLTGGGKLLTYEHLVDPDPTPSCAVLWRWEEVNAHSALVRGLGTRYSGRPLFCLYNEATGIRNGTTPNLFATIAFYPPNKVDIPHRHTSSALNYILEGSGWSVVDGTRVEWKAGDIMLSAPGWAPHGHASGEEGATILTVQDEPLQLATESLVWQENLTDAPILRPGKQQGFQTNAAALVTG